MRLKTVELYPTAVERELVLHQTVTPNRALYYNRTKDLIDVAVRGEDMREEALEAGVNYLDKREFGKWMRSQGWVNRNLSIGGRTLRYYVKFKAINQD
jgi:hypothetical protein